MTDQSRLKTQSVTQSAGQIVTVTDRRELCADGVKNILQFTENYLELESSLGNLCVEGEGLKIEGLDQSNGKIRVTGKICAVVYGEVRQRRRLFGGRG